MRLNAFSSNLPLVINLYIGLGILIFCISNIILILKWKALINIVKIAFVIFSVISVLFICNSFYLSTVFGKISSIGIIGGSDGPTAVYISETNNGNKINGLELFYNDYEIMKYDEHKTDGSLIQMNFSLKIINSKKINILENDVISIIYVNINNKRYLAKGQLGILSTFPQGCDCMFLVNNAGKIGFFENKVIDFLGFRNTDE